MALNGTRSRNGVSDLHLSGVSYQRYEIEMRKDAFFTFFLFFLQFFPNFAAI
jgi:hypothetical protein